MSKIKQTLDDFKPDSRLVDERGATDERLEKAAEHVFRDDSGRRHMRDSTLEIALSKKQISSRQYNGAQKFYNHWFRGGLSENFGSINFCMVFTGFGPSDGLARSEQQTFHRQSYFNAMKWLGKRAWIAHDIVIRERPFEEVGRKMGWNNRPQAMAAGVESTRTLLDKLCDEWGILD